MKTVKAIHIFICCALALISLTKVQAQDNNPCTQEWSEWYNVYTFQHNVNFQIAFKVQIRNRKGGECGTSYYRLSNPVVIPGAHLEFKFDYRKKDGSIGTETFGYEELNKTGIRQNNTGQWYVGFEMVRIYDVKFFDPEAEKAKKAEKDLDKRFANTKLPAMTHMDSVKAKLPRMPGDAMGRRADNTTTPNATKPAVQSVAITNYNAPVKTQQQIQQQQYQQQANTYLNAAANSNGAIDQSMNLNLAKINAAASGNTAQVAQIQQQINTQQVQGITEIGNQLVGLLNANSEARERREAAQAETRRQNEETSRKLEEYRRQEEAETAQREAAESQRQANMDQGALGQYLIKRKNSEIPETIKKVFFITYERPHNYSSIIKLKTYALNAYSDNTWMMQVDMLKKLSFTETFNKDSTKRIVGFFTSQQEALGLIEGIKAYFKGLPLTADNTFIELNAPANAKKKDDDFWKQE